MATYRKGRVLSRTSAGISCESVQLPKYAEPAIHGSVTRTGERSWQMRVALPIVSKPRSIHLPSASHIEGLRRPAPRRERTRGARARSRRDAGAGGRERLLAAGD